MKCQRCGADIPNGEVFCIRCGEEVQLVPDYNSLEYMMQQKKAMEDLEIREEEERLRRQARQERREKELKKRKKRKIILIIILVLLLLGAAVIGTVYFVQYKQENSFEYQYAKAYEAYEANDLKEASKYAERALVLSPNDDNIMLLAAEIRIESAQMDEGIELLLSYIENHPDSADAYAYLISIYEGEQRYNDIKALMENCKNDNILIQFAEYVPMEVKLLTAEGEYTKKTAVELEFSGGTVYYTLDGTNPDVNSEKYTGPVLLEEGTTTFKAVAYSPTGVPSDMIEAKYTVTLARPNPPFISPASGNYEEDSEITVIVPEGCTAYYAFDTTATVYSTIYSEPVTMKKGEHIFSVIVVDENGKQSYPASETYVVE